MAYYKGIEFGHKLYLKNIEKYGLKEVIHREKIVKTCSDYAFNNRTKKTKTGKLLTKENRLFYKGVVDFLNAPSRMIYDFKNK